MPKKKTPQIKKTADSITTSITSTLKKYQKTFKNKVYTPDNDDSDVLMDIFEITPEKKRENRQYWGRQLGAIWETIVIAIAKEKCPKDYKEGLKYGKDRPCDLIIGKDAIDTKYRIGSGDSGTLKKFKEYGKKIKDEKYNPVILILRKDSLPNAVTACKNGGWTVYEGDSAFKYLQDKTNEDIHKTLADLKGKYSIDTAKKSK